MMARNAVPGIARRETSRGIMGGIIVGYLMAVTSLSDLLSGETSQPDRAMRALA
jgi:hypothetical protein